MVRPYLKHDPRVTGTYERIGQSTTTTVESDRHSFRDSAELLRRAAQRPDPERIVFLEERVAQGSEI